MHADLDSFYASVEQRDDPRLRGRPVLVGGGVVLAASYEAKAFGIRSAMNGRQARSLCPWAIVVEPRMTAYSEASKAVFEVFEHTTPLVEGLSIDEAFLDVGGLRRVSGTPTEIASRLRADVREQVGLPITVGVARTKFLAKVASGVGKPDGLLVVPPDRELAFLHPLAVERLWGVGPVTAREVAQPGDQYCRRGGAPARKRARVDARARGRAVICTRSRTTAIRGRCRSAGAAVRSARSARSADRPSRRKRSTRWSRSSSTGSRVGMRAASRAGRTVALRLRFDDFSRVTRSHTLAHTTSHTPTILATVRALLHDAMPADRAAGVTLLGVSVGNLDSGDVLQLPLPFDRLSDGALDVALDGVRDRFGSASVTRAASLGQDPGWSIPMLPD